MIPKEISDGDKIRKFNERYMLFSILKRGTKYLPDLTKEGGKILAYWSLAAAVSNPLNLKAWPMVAISGVSTWILPKITRTILDRSDFTGIFTKEELEIFKAIENEPNHSKRDKMKKEYIDKKIFEAKTIIKIAESEKEASKIGQRDETSYTELVFEHQNNVPKIESKKFDGEKQQRKRTEL